MSPRCTEFQLLPTDNLDVLPAPWRDLLRAAEDANYDGLATNFNLPVGTVKSRLHRARLRILAQRESAKGDQPAEDLVPEGV